ncbi:WecB/TagA/CpsF family glycosyltransferase [Ideonella sp. NS12-5]|uniref:WecB/TagA/CpsF family glycosyltransferase n=1 Tax=Ideonella oryzae TaxID=2937441 RepID=A0ABT1BRR6_9BURK|nr:WecB/TagA/CpsF family glycosyltransferase [Ideonella oryzae]
MVGVNVLRPSSVPDFTRDVVCVLGLPFDVISLEQVAARVRSARLSRTPLLLATANLNFIVAARNNAPFRQAIIHSQLNLADGMPIVWVAKLLRVPLPARVAGSSLFERLQESSSEAPVKVFFFGAPDGVAEQACHRVNALQGGVCCVGYESPGFGTVESMSSDDQIRRINEAQPDFLVVALGAEKGLAWIERNFAGLEAPVVSHLGAVVGMAAGHIHRAPPRWQRWGLEWLWRIKEEPFLWRRYWSDAKVFSRLLAGSVLPLWWHQVVEGAAARASGVRATGMTRGGAFHLRLIRVSVDEGDGEAQSLSSLRAQLASAAASGLPVVVEAQDLVHIDGRVLGLLMLLYGHLRDRSMSFTIQGVSACLRRQFRWHEALFLLDADSAVAPTSWGQPREVA